MLTAVREGRLTLTAVNYYYYKTLRDKKVDILYFIHLEPDKDSYTGIGPP